MRGMVCVITGGTSGLGRATALALGSQGADLLLIGRNVRAAQAVVTTLRRRRRGGNAEFLQADLSSLVDVRRVAADIRRQTGVLHVLVNNAGARFDDHQVSADGVERTFATNHLGHFLLTALLLDLLLGAPAARIISVASGAHWGASERGNWILQPETYDRKAAYAESKLANILFSYELARRLENTGVTSNALDPGGVATNLGRNNGPIAWLRHLAYYALQRKLRRPRKAAETIVYLAADPHVAGVTGRYFRDLQEASSSPLSYDVGAATRLWKASVQLTGLDERLGVSWRIFAPRDPDL